MRQLFLFFAGVVTALCGHAEYQNYLVPGTRFYDCNYNIVLSDYTMRYGMECMELVVLDNPWFSSKGFVYVDGTKVMFHPSVNDTEWELAYDFGMQPGDHIQVVDMDTGIDYHHLVYDIECASIEEAQDFPGQQAMRIRLRSISDPYNHYSYIEGEWLLGIGSIWGICANAAFGEDGGYFGLYRVVLADGTEVCRATYYKDEDFDSIEAVSTVEETRAVYYDLQGQRVENPVRGIYVKVCNGVATKVAVR